MTRKQLLFRQVYLYSIYILVYYSLTMIYDERV